MNDFQFVYGPVPSRRLGTSLGISPIPQKTCNYSCVYCQLGRTDKLTNNRQMFFEVDKIMAELEKTIHSGFDFDVVTIVGEGEPTLYKGLGELIAKIKLVTEKPVAVITNGSLLHDTGLQLELESADIILPSLDAYDEGSFKKINRPHGKLHFAEIYQGMKDFSQKFSGEIWIEIMLVLGLNDDDNALLRFSDLLKDIRYDRLYLNTPVRPPAEEEAKAVSRETMKHAVEILDGTSIDLLVSSGFHSEISDHYEAIISIIKRHPMNQFEIESFLKSRGCNNMDFIFLKLGKSGIVERVDYKGYMTYLMR
ncbi:MAG: radical SAM protein [Eubacteriales bacterium]|nr:radical SAM protein [Eubacteriales bacterium]